MDANAYNRAIDALELCHVDVNNNLIRLYLAITRGEQPQVSHCGHVLACGTQSPERHQRASAFAMALEAWRRGEVYADPVLMESIDLLLGERTTNKLRLIEHLILKLRNNRYHVYEAQDEDLNTLEARIEHLEICQIEWESNLHKLLAEIGQEKMLYPWNQPGGFLTCSAPEWNRFPTDFQIAVAKRHSLDAPKIATQKSIQELLRAVAKQLHS